MQNVELRSGNLIGNEMREEPVREYLAGLWCGKIQQRCSGGKCPDCHMYPTPRVEPGLEVQLYNEA